MKILHLLYESKGDYFGIGGVGERAYKIYGYLKDRHDVTLLCKKYPGAPQNKEKEIEGLKHIFVGSQSRSLTKSLLTYAYKAAKFVKRHGNEFDIIIEDFSPAIPTFLHTYNKRPLVLQVQGYTGRFYFRKYNPLYASILFIIEYFRPRLYNNFVFISDESARRVLLKDKEADDNKHIEIIPNGVSPGLLDTAPREEGYILYLGRIDIYSKGLDILIDAYREFYKSFSGVKLVIAGDGRDMKNFKDMLEKLPRDIKSDVKLLGWVSDDKKSEVISRALFCVFPSRHEVQSIAALEAMACEKAVIVSDLPEFNYIIQNRAGINFKTGDAISLSRAMKEFMENKEQRGVMGRTGREFMKNFTWDRVGDKFEEFLYRILEGVRK